ncbi:hypothetical protein J7J13_03595 [bacterium]|nr:hypothetical protein [bacterium]
MLLPEFKEALKLMDGKAILFDEDECYVVMTLEEFKKIKKDEAKNLTKKEPLDKINSDVNLWKNSEEVKNEKGLNFQELEKREEKIKYVR